eukprot:scaffold118505_cov32-Prasinocladus_malaysianus.AAC.1
MSFECVSMSSRLNPPPAGPGLPAPEEAGLFGVFGLPWRPPRSREIFPDPPFWRALKNPSTWKLRDPIAVVGSHGTLRRVLPRIKHSTVHEGPGLSKQQNRVTRVTGIVSKKWLTEKLSDMLTYIAPPSHLSTVSSKNDPVPPTKTDALVIDQLKCTDK